MLEVNYFKLAGRVSEIKGLEDVQIGNNVQKQYRLLLEVTKYKTSKYYIPINFWGEVATEAADEIILNSNVEIEGKIVSRYYQNKSTGSESYYLDLSANNYHVLPSAASEDISTNTEQNIRSSVVAAPSGTDLAEEDTDDVPF